VDDDGWDNEGDFSVNISSDEEFVAPRNPDVVDLFGLFPNSIDRLKVARSSGTF
jgi:hypothetical protein